MKILFKFATRSRPQKFFACLENIIQMIDDKINYEIIASYDEDDSSMEIQNIEKDLVKILGVPVKLNMICGKSSNKINAINRDIFRYGKNFDILINTSDDMMFTQKGFDNIIRGDMIKYFPDLDGVLHYPDQNQGSSCMTMSIMGRKYYERDNFIYDPRFESLWCDVVAQEMAQMRGRYQFINNQLFHHNHPSFGECLYDEQYRKTESWEVRQRDYETYLHLKKEYDPNNTIPIRNL